MLLLLSPSKGLCPGLKEEEGQGWDWDRKPGQDEIYNTVFIMSSVSAIHSFIV